MPPGKVQMLAQFGSWVCVTSCWWGISPWRKSDHSGRADGSAGNSVAGRDSTIVRLERCACARALRSEI